MWEAFGRDIADHFWKGMTVRPFGIENLCSTPCSGFAGEDCVLFSFGGGHSGKSYTAFGLKGEEGVIIRLVRLVMERCRTTPSGRDRRLQLEWSLYEVIGPQRVRQALAPERHSGR